MAIEGFLVNNKFTDKHGRMYNNIPNGAVILDGPAQNSFTPANELPAAPNPQTLQKPADTDTNDLSIELIKKHPGTIPALIALQQTPPEYIKTICDFAGNPVMKNNRETHYVPGHIMKREANYAFLFNWDSIVKEMWDDEYEISALVQCTFKFTEGYTVTKTQVGTADKKFSKTLKDKDGNFRNIMIGETRKAAITDGCKKCMADVGLNDDVYSGRV